jgi:hypothetical protein
MYLILRCHFRSLPSWVQSQNQPVSVASFDLSSFEACKLHLLQELMTGDISCTWLSSKYSLWYKIKYHNSKLNINLQNNSIFMDVFMKMLKNCWFMIHVIEQHDSICKGTYYLLFQAVNSLTILPLFSLKLFSILDHKTVLLLVQFLLQDETPVNI